jgi:hypothetical protein
MSIAVISAVFCPKRLLHYRTIRKLLAIHKRERMASGQGLYESSLILQNQDNQAFPVPCKPEKGAMKDRSRMRDDSYKPDPHPLA